MGTPGGAWLVDHLAKSDLRWSFWLPALANLITVPLALAIGSSVPVLATLCLAAGARTVARDVERAKRA